MPKVFQKLINIVLFQLGWFACVLSAAEGRSWTGPLVSLAIVLLHGFWIEKKKSVLSLLVVTGLWGTLMEQGLITFKAYTLTYPFDGFFFDVPAWFSSMWVLFGTTLRVSFSWLHGKYFLAAILGFIFGPLSYYGGSQLGPIDFGPSPVFGLLLVAIVWGISMPILLWLSKILNEKEKPSRMESL